MLIAFAGCTSGKGEAFIPQELGIDPEREPAFKATDPVAEPVPIVEQSVKYSYLDNLSADQQDRFDDFVADRDLRHLADFAPEDMLAVFLHILSIGDPYLLYPITYDGGMLPDEDIFHEQYREHFDNDASDLAVHYRHYEAVEIDEEHASEDQVITRVKVHVGVMTHSLALQLKKEAGIWKIDIYHSIDPEWEPPEVEEK